MLHGQPGPACPTRPWRCWRRAPEGWAARLQLAGLSLRGQANVESFVATFSGSHRYVLDYLAGEVLERQAEQVRTFFAGDIGAGAAERCAMRFLDHVLGVGDAAEHPVGGRQRDRPHLVKQPPAIGHAAANPCRQLACLGCQPRSRLAFAFEAPRISVMNTAPVSPANSRPTNRGTRIGFLVPSS